jgi:proline dehydrogenase
MVNIADGRTYENSRSATLAVNSDELSTVTCIGCAELELELKRTQTELKSTDKIVKLLREEIKLMAEDNVCRALSANASSSEVRRPSGLHQLNDVLNKDNHTQKDRSDKIKELKSDIAELNHLLKHDVRQSVKEFISTEVNITLAKIESLYENASEQALIEPRWTSNDQKAQEK